MALDTVQDYLDNARRLLIDSVEPYRYPDGDLVDALNIAILESRRLRPELFRASLSGSLPAFSTADLSEQVPVDPQYRMAILYYVCGHAHLVDDEINQDSRAAVFLNKFTSQMLTIQA